MGEELKLCSGLLDSVLMSLLCGYTCHLCAILLLGTSQLLVTALYELSSGTLLARSLRPAKVCH